MGWTTKEAQAFALTLAATLAPVAAFVGVPALAVTSGLFVASAAPPPPDPPGALTLAQPLTLSTSVVGGGQTISGRAVYRNDTSEPIALKTLVVAVRPPGGTNSGGPFDDMSPARGPLTVEPGQSVSIAASRTLPHDAAVGTWRAYVTTEDAQGAWRDGNEVEFQVVAPLPSSSPTPSSSSASPAPGYTVKGNEILDARGQPHLFHGVDRPSLEWSATGENLSAHDYQLMASWGANVVRIALNQDFWLSGAADFDPTYAARIDRQIAWAHAAGLDVILDLHWSDAGDLTNTKPGQQPMADVDSLEFWREVAQRYKNDPRVLFELYNEPHDISWDTWLHGGTAHDSNGNAYQAIGMQELADAVRSTGAQNLVLVGGDDWAYDLTGVPDHTVQGQNVVYVSHSYEGAGHEPSDWDNDFGFVAQSHPVMVTEFGSTDGKGDYDQAFIDYAKAHGISWSAWAWYPGGDSFPSLVTDWNGTPTVPGAVVKAALEADAPRTAAAVATSSHSSGAMAKTTTPSATPGITGALGGVTSGEGK